MPKLTEQERRQQIADLGDQLEVLYENFAENITNEKKTAIPEYTKALGFVNKLITLFTEDEQNTEHLEEYEKLKTDLEKDIETLEKKGGGGKETDMVNRKKAKWGRGEYSKHQADTNFRLGTFLLEHSVEKIVFGLFCFTLS